MRLIMCPGNDDAIRAIKLITSKIADAVLEGKQGEQFNAEDIENKEKEEVEEIESKENGEDNLEPAADSIEK